MTLTGDELLDLDGTSRRNETFRFEVLDATLASIGTIDVQSNRSPPSIVNDSNASTKRRVTGMTIAPEDYAALDLLNDRIRISHIVGSGGAGYEWPLGVFLFGDSDDDEMSFGTLGEVTLVDQGVLLQQLLDTSVSYPTGTIVEEAIAEQAGLAGIASTSIDPLGTVLTAPIVGVIGRDTRGNVVDRLCAAGGYLPWYFTNAGALRARQVPDLSTLTADHEYGPGTGSTGRVEAGTVRRASGILTAPNRYVAYEQTSTGDIVGIFDIPDSAEHSFANIGRYVTRAEAVQGIADQASADAAAAALYANDDSVFETRSFTTPVDGRHETFDVIRWDAGSFYLEQLWQLECRVGGRMSHETRRLYT